MSEQNSPTIACRRCGAAEAPALAFAPWPGELGRAIQNGTCRACWD